MPTIQDMRTVDCLGFGRFTDKQIHGLVRHIQSGRLLECPVPKCAGDGIVIAGGGKYLDWSIVLVRWIRALGCRLPIQVWHLGAEEMPEWGRVALKSDGATAVDGLGVLKSKPHRMLREYAGAKKWTYAGWLLKNFAIEHCPFARVLFLDADCFPAINPQELFDDVELRGRSLFFSDVANHAPGPWAWINSGLTPPVREAECGQYLVDKVTGWMGLRWAHWLGEHADTFFKMLHGDKDLTVIGFRIAESPITVSTENAWEDFGISQRWKGREWFRHSMNFKRSEGTAPWPAVQQMFWDLSDSRKCSDVRCSVEAAVGAVLPRD